MTWNFLFSMLKISKLDMQITSKLTKAKLSLMLSFVLLIRRLFWRNFTRPLSLEYLALLHMKHSNLMYLLSSSNVSPILSKIRNIKDDFCFQSSRLKRNVAASALRHERGTQCIYMPSLWSHKLEEHLLTSRN